MSLGIPISDIPAAGLLKGHVGDDAVVLARSGDEFFAIGAICTHYHAPLVDGSFDGESSAVRGIMPVSAFRTGEAVRAPALIPLAVLVGGAARRKDLCPGKKERAQPNGAQGGIRAEAARASSSSAVERPALPPPRCCGASNIRAASSCSAMTMRPPSTGRTSPRIISPATRPRTGSRCARTSFYADNAIDLRLETRRRRHRRALGEVTLARREHVPVSTGCCSRPAPSRCGLTIPGADQPHVHTRCARLPIAARSSRRRKTARRAVVIGASFIGLEVAASLRARDIEVHVVAPDKRPMERILGPQMGDFVRALHEEHGVVFHLEDTVDRDRRQAGQAQERRRCSRPIWSLSASACGPRLELAEKAGLTIDRGVIVNAYLETSAPGIFAAGDIARWPDPHTGESIRVEHWVVAERQGQTAARNMLGAREKFTLCRSSGASTTTCRSTMSATPRNGTTSTRGRHRQGLPAALQAQWPGTRGRFDLSRPGEPSRRKRDGKRTRNITVSR